jgi:hypothetical protein
MSKPVAFSEDGARRVIAATKAVEAGNRDMPGIRFRDAGGDDGDPVRLGKTSAAWTKGTTATINVWESGTAGSETQTSGVTLNGCVNKFADVAAGKWVIMARCQNGAYYLIAAECS